MASLPPTAEKAEVVLAIDPGSAKCGVAVVRRPGDRDGSASVMHREVVERDLLVARIVPLLLPCRVEAVLIGNATGSAALTREVREALPDELPLIPVNEAFTSQRARARYLREHPPRGWERLVPPGFRTPDRPYDDYVAVILAEDFFARTGNPAERHP